MILYIVVLFLAKWFVSYLLVAAFLGAVIWISKIHLSVIFKSLKPLLLIIILTAVLNLFYSSGEPIVKFLDLQDHERGHLQRGVYGAADHAARGGDFMLTYTTSPISLTDGLESLLSPLKKIQAAGA